MATYEFENRTRQVLRFPVYSRGPERAKGAYRQLIRDHDKDLVLGDANDKVLKPGVARGPRCPSPVARWSDEDLARLDAVQREQLDRYVSDGTLTRNQLAG